MKKYYSLKRSGKQYKPVEYAVVCVAFTDDWFITSYLIRNGIGKEVMGAVELVKEFRKLPDKSWVITYNSDFLPAIYKSALGLCKRIEQIGDATNYAKIKFATKEIYLVDIYNFFYMSLSKLCENVGYITTGYVDYQPDFGHSEYVENRARAIKAVWDEYVDILKEQFNVFPSKSPGTTALKLYKSMLPVVLKPRSIRVRKLTVNSVKAGALHWQPGVYNHAWMYDINASYPYAMRMMMPRYSQAFSGKQPKTKYWIATVKLSYECIEKFSPLHIPATDDYHYSVNKATDLVTTINYIDYDIMRNMGDLKITEWIEGVYWNRWQTSPIFDAWSRRIEVLSEIPEYKPLLKIISRALHSKFNQTNKPIIGVVRKISPKMVERTRNIVNLFELWDGGLGVIIQKSPRISFRAYDLPEYESLTLSRGRYLLYSMIDEDTVYADTDCIISVKERPDLNVGTRFGEWKVSDYGMCAIAGPRMYAFKDTVKASGIFSLDKDSLRHAIYKAAEGEKAVMETEDGGKFSIRQIKYPCVEVVGDDAYVTRSPTIKVGVLKVNKEITW